MILLELRKEHGSFKITTFFSTGNEKPKSKNAVTSSHAMRQYLAIAQEMQDGITLDDMQRKRFY